MEEKATQTVLNNGSGNFVDTMVGNIYKVNDFHIAVKTLSMDGDAATAHPVFNGIVDSDILLTLPISRLTDKVPCKDKRLRQVLNAWKANAVVESIVSVKSEPQFTCFPDHDASVHHCNEYVGNDCASMLSDKEMLDVSAVSSCTQPVESDLNHSLPAGHDVSTPSDQEQQDFDGVNCEDADTGIAYTFFDHKLFISLPKLLKLAGLEKHVHKRGYLQFNKVLTRFKFSCIKSCYVFKAGNIRTHIWILPLLKILEHTRAGRTEKREEVLELLFDLLQRLAALGTAKIRKSSRRPNCSVKHMVIDKI